MAESSELITLVFFGCEKMTGAGLAAGVGRGTARAALLALLAALTLTSWSQQKQTDLTSESLEDLMDVQVTSVSKTGQTLSQAASAIFVINQDAIRRSGANNIPDLLRMVPGVDVARIGANAWAISIRGFNARFSNQLLVLLDGRTVYTPTFGGVFWDVLDLPLQDVERIEVIRGPGGSIWGANAVNGVINIITSTSSESHGGLLVGGGGNLDQGFGTVQYGGPAGKRTDYRAYTKYLNVGSFPGLTMPNGGDGWRSLRGGFRIDSVLSSKDTLTLLGDVYNGREGNLSRTFVFDPLLAVKNVELLVNLSGGFLQGAWTHTSSPRSMSSLQVSYDAYRRNDTLREHRRTIDLDFQHNYDGWKRQKIVSGFNYRFTTSGTNGIFNVLVVPPALSTQLFGSFIQDEVIVVPDKLALTVGAKLEHNHYTGFGAMPTARVAWTPTQRQTLWAAVSKTERTPSELDASLRADIATFPGPGGLPVLVTISGNPRVENEQSTDYEVGYRTMFTPQFSVDLTAYYNRRSHLNTNEPSTPFFVASPSPHLVVPLIISNLMHGETHGSEMAANWKVTNRWTLGSGYAFEQIHMHLSPASGDTGSASAAQGSSPVNAAQLRSHLALAPALAWDTSAYFVGRLNDPKEPSYTRLDTVLSCQISERINLSVAGQNFLQGRHQEFVDATGTSQTTLIKRSVFARLEWQF